MMSAARVPVMDAELVGVVSEFASALADVLTGKSPALEGAVQMFLTRCGEVGVVAVEEVRDLAAVADGVAEFRLRARAKLAAVRG